MATMTQAVSRFLTFDLGKGDIAKLQKTFSTSVNILLLMSIVVVLLSLGIAFALTVSPIDKLIYYGLLVFAVELCIQMMFWISPKLQSNIHWKTITIQNHRFVHLGFIKFYRRYTLENLMSILVDEQFEGSLNSQRT